jgi:uncharacterized protein YwgA
MAEDFRLLAGVIAAHPRRKVHGRTRLQKTVKLLQSLGLPTRFIYSIHFYGPYSEDLQACIGLLEQLGLAREGQRVSTDSDNFYYIVEATDAADPELVKDYQWAIDLMEQAPVDILELAATYQAFRELGETREAALERLKRKKAKKCVGNNVDHALELRWHLKLEPADPKPSINIDASLRRILDNL